MKTIFSIVALFFATSSLAAQTPEELLHLFPPDTNRVRLKGWSKDDKKCIIDMENSKWGFSASVMILDKYNSVDSKRLGKFQIGLGHELQNIEIQQYTTVVITSHQAKESYNKDLRSTFKVNTHRDEIAWVQIIMEEKELLGYKTVVNETCLKP